MESRIIFYDAIEISIDICLTSIHIEPDVTHRKQYKKVHSNTLHKNSEGPYLVAKKCVAIYDSSNAVFWDVSLIHMHNICVRTT